MSRRIVSRTSGGFWDVNGRDGCFSVLVSVGWLGKGEHVLENGRGEREDEFVNAEVMH